MNVVVGANRHVAALGRLRPAFGHRRPCPPASAAALLGMAELLDTIAFVEGDGVEEKRAHEVSASMIGLARQSITTATTAARIAEQHAIFARQLFGRLLACCAHSQLQRCSRAAVAALTVGVLLGLLVLGLLAVITLEPGPLLVVPAAATLAAVVVLTDRWRDLEQLPAVRGIGVAAADLRSAWTTLRRARRDATVVTRGWAGWARRTRSNVASWCKRHGVPADAATLRWLAMRTTIAQ
jgi:hypothetical protein